MVATGSCRERADQIVCLTPGVLDVSNRLTLWYTA
jgi:hypothetical protein